MHNWKIYTYFQDDWLVSQPQKSPRTSVHNPDNYINGWTKEDDWKFLTYLRDYWLVAPSGGPRNISPGTPNKHSDYSQKGQSQFIDKVGLTVFSFKRCSHGTDDPPHNGQNLTIVSALPTTPDAPCNNFLMICI